MKALVVYFSYSNNTKKIVEKVDEVFCLDTVRVERKIPYSKDYDTCAYVEAKKEVDERIYPEILPLKRNPEDYDAILIFFPIWWYTFPMPIGTFARSLAGYKGKVYLFGNSYTDDKQYLKNSVRDFKGLVPDVDVTGVELNEPVEKIVEEMRKIVR